MKLKELLKTRTKILITLNIIDSPRNKKKMLALSICRKVRLAVKSLHISI